MKNKAKILLPWFQLVFVLCSLSSFLACAPRQAHRVYLDGGNAFGPKQQDPDLGLTGASARGSDVGALLHFSGTVDSASYFQTASSLLMLSSNPEHANLAPLALRLADAFYIHPETAGRVSFADSPYVLAATGETKQSSAVEIRKQKATLESQRVLVLSVLNRVRSRFPWPASYSQISGPGGMLTAVQNFLIRLTSELAQQGVDRRVLGAFKAKLQTDVTPMLHHVQADASAVLAETDPLVMIPELRNLLRKYNFSISSETSARLDQVSGVLQLVKQMQSSQEALTVIVHLWQMTTPAEHESSFKPVSPELYGFLAGMGASELDCLAQEICLLLPLEAIKRIKVLPAISEFGVANLRPRLLASVREGIVSRVLAEAGAQVKTVPDLVMTQVDEQFANINKSLESAEQNYPALVRNVALRFAAQPGMISPPALNSSRGSSGNQALLHGLESAQVSVNPLSAGRFEVTPVKPASNAAHSMETGAAVLGSTILFATERWKRTDLPITDFSFRRQGIEVFNKLLVMGGFLTPSGAHYPALAVASEKASAPNGQSAAALIQHLDLRSFLINADSEKNAKIYSVPDRVQLSGAYSGLANAQAHAVSAEAQAQLLSGLCGMIDFTRDWQSTEFDRLFSSINVDSFLSEFPKGSIDQTLFPKDILFALSLGNAAVILENLESRLTPVFLLDLDRQIEWADTYAQPHATPAAMAAVVDMKDGQRAVVAHARDAAQYLIAIAHFIKSTDGIEKTQNSLLQTKGKDGQSPLSILIDARADLKLLVLALANFLSHEMQATDGGMNSDFDLTTKQVRKTQNRDLRDQTISILALNEASDILGVEIYRWAALDIYSYMNRELFDKKSGFYAKTTAALAASASPPSSEPLDLPLLVETLRAGEALRSQMPLASQKQWTVISDPWFAVLGKF